MAAHLPGLTFLGLLVAYTNPSLYYAAKQFMTLKLGCHYKLQELQLPWATASHIVMSTLSNATLVTEAHRSLEGVKATYTNTTSMKRGSSKG